MNHTKASHVHAGNHEAGEGYPNLLPKQYYDIIAGRRRGDGARDLMAAVLEDAIRAYITNLTRKTRRQRNRFAEVNDWIEARGDTGPFSFETICETFDINPEHLRRKLKEAPPAAIPRRGAVRKQSATKAA